ncbi:hypothetical protein N7491_001034 [Penicillium cf. griseofulvum]|uniref:Uncharacterized protein n=1 Tax=Penicillium cf. griseofulvum TaxID=2972120 RepID=A0A9W9M9F2_9EURO|nr:hypothetical protein N7472_006169 [Penicillium cf. griseofulvum]KAJ5444952.1 hypothetical protein N7491_001034 [Penicillium cf. griseofulvum]
MPRTRRRWTPEEDAVLKKAVTTVMEQSRPIMWRELAKQVPGRSNKDCRRRWWNTLGGGTTKGLWSEEEDRLLTEADERLLHEVLTNSTNWSVIATTHDPRRTTLSLKNRYATLRLRHEKGATGKQPPQEPGASSQDLMDQTDEEEDRGDSGRNDESGDEDNYDDVLDLPPITGSSFTASDPSMLPATPLDWMDIFNQTGDLPSAPLINTAMSGAELGTCFDPGAISGEMGNSPLLGSSGILHICRTTVSASPLGHNPAQHVFDYVIVGSGPGGLTVANRLTENPKVSVAVIEAGTWAEDVVGNLSAVPGYAGKYLLKSVNSIPTGIDWGFVTTPQAGINDLVVRYPRGKVEGSANKKQIGGSTNLNAMAWGESSRGAFSKWADEVGDKSFTYESIAQYYKKPVRFTPYRDGTRFANATPSYDPAEVGHSGTLDVTYPAYAYSWTTWLAVMLEAAGMPAQNTYIDGSLNGSAWHMSATSQATGKRSSADTAYLLPVLGRRNLVVFQKTMAERILFSHGNVATGVQVSSDNSTFTLQARKEVIVAGGVFQSPQILQVSGVGPSKLLKKHGIPVVADRPGVGQNMQDQIFADVVYRVNLPTGDTLRITEADVTAFNANATGPLTNPGGEYGGFEDIPADLRSGLSDGTLNSLADYPPDWPDIQYLTLPRFLGDLGTTPSPNDGNNYASLMGIIMKPKSTGSVSISSASMHDPPIINPNWMTTDADLEVMVAIFKRMRQLWRSPAMKKIIIGDEIWPGSSVESDQEIIAFLRKTVTPMSHATSTCKMGKRSDPLAVVDSKAKVIGVKNLRVIDSSAMPFLPAGGEPQSVVYMLAEKIADMIKAE